MLKLFAYLLDAVCSLAAVFFTIGLTVGGVFFGRYLGEFNRMSSANTTLIMVLIGIGCFIISFIINTLVFGLIANVIEIRKNLEKLNEK